MDTDPTGGTAAPYTSDADLFEKIGADIPDTPEATPTPAEVEGTPPAKAAPETPAPSAEPERDAQGRFKKTEAAPAAPVPPQAETAAPTAPPAPAEAPAAPTAPDLSQFPAYEYRAGTRTVPLPGAVRGSEGVLIPTASLPHLEQLLAAAHQAHAKESAWGRERLQLQAQTKAAQDEKNEVLGRLAEIMSDPAKFDAWAADTQGNWEKLLLQARLKIAEQERDSRSEQYDEVVTEQQVQALVPQLRTSVETTVQRLAADAEFKDLALDAAWQKEFGERLLQTHFDRLFSEATEADVAKGIAAQVGDTIFDPQPILDELRYQATFARKELARQKGLAEAAARNAATAQPAAAVPTAGAKPTGSPSAKPKPALHHGMTKNEVDQVVFSTIED